jgi:hypothetical protein
MKNKHLPAMLRLGADSGVVTPAGDSSIPNQAPAEA